MNRRDERILHTVILPDGLPLDICQRFSQESFADGSTIQVPGLRCIRIAGGTITLPEAHDILKRTGNADVIEKFNIPAY